MSGDLFTAAPQFTEVVRNGRTYRILPRPTLGAPSFGITWLEPGRSGVIGGFYATEADALAQIELSELARRQRAMVQQVAA